MLNPDTKIYVRIGGRKITIPVNPEELQVTHPNQDKTADVVGVGEILIPQKPGLKEVTFSSFFPGFRSDPYVHDYLNPKRIAKAFERAWKNRTRCRLIISRSIDYDTNMSCVISDWKISDRGGEPDDLYYEVTFREYRAYGVSQMTVIAPATTGVESGEKAITASASVVREVDPSQLIVGAKVALNGSYYASSAGGGVLGNASNQSGTIQRIVTGAEKPYYINGVGWFGSDAVLPGGDIWQLLPQ